MSEGKSLKKLWHNPAQLLLPTVQIAMGKSPPRLQKTLAPRRARPARENQQGRGKRLRRTGLIPGTWLGRWGAGWFIAGALLILTHGCHGEDVDDEPAAGPVQRQERDQRPLRLPDVEPAAEDTP
jgi:hypothetical protein